MNRNAHIRRLLADHKRICAELDQLGVSIYHPPPGLYSPKWVRDILADAQRQLDLIRAA